VKQRAPARSLYVIALLCGGSVIPATGWTHWEGFEAADPATPSAVLSFNSAVAGYTELDAGPAPWRALADAAVDSSATGAQNHAGHAGAASQTPATTQQ